MEVSTRDSNRSCSLSFCFEQSRSSVGFSIKTINRCVNASWLFVHFVWVGCFRVDFCDTGGGSCRDDIFVGGRVDGRNGNVGRLDRQTTCEKE